MPVASQLSFDRGIPRDIVHRESIAEVFLTDNDSSKDCAVFAAQLPRNHSYFSDHRGASTTYDPLLLVEVFRQVAIGYAHIYLDVGRDQKFIFNSAGFEVTTTEALTIGSCPGHCVVKAQVSDRKYFNGHVTGLTLEMSAVIDGIEAARETMVYQWVPKEVWARIRSKGRAALSLGEDPTVLSKPAAFRMRPSSVGRHNPRNAILADPRVDDAGVSALTIIDTDHPSLFDHALDHIPGMLQFEAARQIAMAAANVSLGLDTTRLVMDEISITFERFGEFELDTIARATVQFDESDSQAAIASFVISQDSQNIALGEVHLSLLPANTWTLIQ